MSKARLDASPEAALRWAGAPLRKPLIAVCALGLALCTSAAVALSVAPGAAETQVRATILVLLEHELSKRFGVAVGDADVNALAKRDLLARIDGARRMLASSTPELLGQMFSGFCHYSCATPTEAAAKIRDRLRRDENAFGRGLLRVEEWARTRYASMIEECVEELRIFATSNAVLFLLGLLGLWKAPRDSRLQVVGLLLVATTALSIYVYVNGQNWLMTFVFSSYTGWAYLVWAGVLFAWLIDLVFLRARVTNLIVNAVAGAVPVP